MIRALLDDYEVVDLANSFPDFRKLRSEQLSKDRSDADVREIIAAAADRGATAGIITVLGMIQRLLHEPSERLWPPLLYFSADRFGENWIAGAHSLIVKSLNR